MRARAWRIGPVIAAAVLGSGCAPEGSDRALVDELRVLAVRARPPEVAPGASVALDALVADPRGRGRHVAWSWAVCTPDPLAGEASCAEPGRTVPLGVGTAATLSVAADTLDDVPPEERERGIDLFVLLSVAAGAAPGGPGEEEEIAFKRVRVSTDAAPNANPSIESLSLSGEGREVRLEARATAASAESFEGSLGPDVEDMKFSWFATAGKLENPITYGEPTGSVNAWAAERPATIWVVLRDGRGGTDWVVREIAP